MKTSVPRAPRAPVWLNPILVRRSESLKVVVFCPHFQRPVHATRNLAIDRLVACDESASCRDADPASDRAPAPASQGHDHARPFPHACPVYPSLAKAG